MIQRKRAVQKKHIAGLDGLRGIAAAAVVLYHMLPQQVKGGFLGVPLFFVLSGYLLAVTSERMARDGEFSPITFYRKRILRIYPAMIIVSGLTVTVLGLLIKIPLNDIRGELLSIVGGYNNWWQISRNTSYFTKVNGTSGLIHMWSLAVEMQYYVIWPVLFFIYRRIAQKAGRRAGILFFLILSLLSLALGVAGYRPGEDASRIYYGTDTRIYALLFGSALGFMRLEAKQRTGKRAGKELTVIFVVSMTAVFALFMSADGQSAFTYWIFLPVSCFLYLIIVSLSVNPALPFGNLLDAAPFSWLGKYSYEIYLCHYPISFVVKTANKGRYSFGQIILELSIVLLISLLLHNGFMHGQKRYGHKRWLPLAGVSVLLLAGMGFILSSGKLAESTDQNELREELQANADLLNTQKGAASQDNIEDGSVNGESNEKQQEYETADKEDVVLIGDSVMLGAGAEIQNAIPSCIVDAAESRQVWDATEIVNEMNREERLGDCVVLGLGSNGSFDEWRGQELIDAIGEDRKIYWLTVYGQYMTWQESVNEMIWRLADANGNMEVVDWASLAQEHSEWFYDDGMHLNSDGQTAYVDFLKENIFALEK